ncbi:unnamed protein product [Echinostoma caproni]|uniref:Phagocyte signaling-impaired protein n=1 Tax=Echinostoma caproni TaxID=27848 RepID=A0A183AJB5_9TREM|nr:unnamed protein product [Echinostoma caproni]
MQAESDPILGQRMFLPLAEKMLSRDADECKMETHIELQLLIELLERLNKPSRALDLLNNADLLSRLDKLDYQVDYTLDRMRLAASLNDWDQVLELSLTRLKEHPNEWNCWHYLIDTAVKNGQWELCEPRVTQLIKLISTEVENHPSVRGPQLAGLDLLTNALRRGWDKYPQTDTVNLLETYVNNFSAKPICALDLAYLIPVLLPKEQIRKQIPGDAKQIYRRLCAYQIARANHHSIPMQQFLNSYFTHVPERLTPSTVNATSTDVPDRTSSLDLCPADGFLLLATSSLMDFPNPMTHISCTVRNFAQALLTAHWIDQLGLAHAPSNHHFRLRLCSLFSLHGLACPELSLPQAERMELKQLLFVSLGHMIISPGPILTLWASPPSAGSQHGDNVNSLLAFFQRLHVLSETCVSEAEDCLVTAYRRRVYTKICEFTKFAFTLKHADVFLLSRMELVYWQVVVVPDDFDILLESLGDADKELEVVSTRIEKSADCRDFSVLQNFDPPRENLLTKEDSFSHTVAWIRLRMLSVRAICQCTQLLMSTVKLSEGLLTNTEQQASAKPESDTKALEALQQLENDKNMLTNLVHQTDGTSLIGVKDVHDLLSKLALPSTHLLTAPVQLPEIQPTSLYLHGPYRTVLESGVRLLVGIHRLLVDGNESFTEAEQTAALQVLASPFRTIPQLLQGDGSSDWAALPRPKPDASTYLNASPEAHSPASMLLLLGMLYETFSLVCMFVSMARSILRPRSHHLQQASKRHRRKAAKTRKAKGPNDVNEEENETTHIMETVAFKRLDEIGSSLLSVIDSLSKSASNLLEVVDAWLLWSRNHAAQELLAASASLCSELFPEELITQYPVIKPSQVTPLMTQIVTNYEESFARVASGLRKKSANLSRISTELQVYDCSEKLASCRLNE